MITRWICLPLPLRPAIQKEKASDYSLLSLLLLLLVRPLPTLNLTAIRFPDKTLGEFIALEIAEESERGWENGKKQNLVFWSVRQSIIDQWGGLRLRAGCICSQFLLFRRLCPNEKFSSFTTILIAAVRPAHWHHRPDQRRHCVCVCKVRKARSGRMRMTDLWIMHTRLELECERLYTQYIIHAFELLLVQWENESSENWNRPRKEKEKRNGDWQFLVETRSAHVAYYSQLNTHTRRPLRPLPNFHSHVGTLYSMGCAAATRHIRTLETHAEQVVFGLLLSIW